MLFGPPIAPVDQVKDDQSSTTGSNRDTLQRNMDAVDYLLDQYAAMEKRLSIYRLALFGTWFCLAVYWISKWTAGLSAE